ncbi:hypothetical protein [Micromonospora sp. KC723]|uniref:hypothetical protein n=1 Tax=Micromonospora sp. KC723 TaxID=2530381 RepID=UPI00104AB840|nr:hypothetical protein [Micromonospora sp. KC723]TDB71595.1 hypothetical protein E1165_22630 [Micromonospora sp. KC723]
MLAIIDALVVRRRRQILICVATATVGLVLAILSQAHEPALASLVTGSGLAVVLLVMSCLSSGRSRPAMLVVEPQHRAFRPPPSAPSVYLAAASALMLCLPAALLPSSSGAHWAWYLFACSAMTYVAVVRISDAWRGTKLHLRPEGIEERSTVRSLFVPWDAVDPARMKRPSLRGQQLTLPYAQPRLVHRRGLGSKKRLTIDTVHPWFIADVTRHYAEHPEHRAAIGTTTEYQRLLNWLADETYPDDNP